MHTQLLHNKSRSGFTIVELLVVIVVIGVLASIVTVAYDGVQKNARNAKTVAVVDAYRKAMIQYALVNGGYPPIVTNGSPANVTCLGLDYPDESIWTLANNRQCGSHTGTGVLLASTSFHDALRPFLSQLPMPSTAIVGDSTNGGRGTLYRNNVTGTVDGGPAQPWHIVYYLEGNVQCPVGPVYSGNNTSGWTSNLATGYSNIFTNGNVGVQCRIILPDPTKL